MEANGADKKESEFIYHKGNTTPLEHKMIGSTPTMPWGDEPVDVLMVRAAQGDRSSLQILLTPLFIQTKDRTADSVKSDRAKEREERTSVGTVIFDPRRVVELSFERAEVYIEPSDVDITTGMIKPEWRVLLLDSTYKQINDRSLLSSLKLHDVFSDYFSFDVQNEPVGILRFKPAFQGIL